MYRFLDPKNDFAFKRVFGSEDNKDVLIAFLNSVFKGVYDTVEGIEFLSPHQDPKIAALRQSIVDVKCTDSKNRQFIVEMQCYSDSHFLKRACVYAARAYADQVVEGVEYSDVKPVVFLAILKQKMFEEEDFLSQNRILNTKSMQCNIKEFSFSFIELGKFQKKFEELETPLDRWCYFLKHAQTTEPNEAKIMEDKCPEVGKAYKTLDQYGYTKEELDEYLKYGMKDDEIATSIFDAKEKGRAEGKLEKARETAVKLLAMGLSLEQVSQATGLSREEITYLKQY